MYGRTSYNNSASDVFDDNDSHTRSEIASRLNASNGHLYIQDDDVILRYAALFAELTKGNETITSATILLRCAAPSATLDEADPSYAYRYHRHIEDHQPPEHKRVDLNKVSEGLGNLESLTNITFNEGLRRGRTPDWEAVASILSQIPPTRRISLDFCVPNMPTNNAEGLANSLHGQACIKALDPLGFCDTSACHVLLSEMASLPALEVATLREIDFTDWEEDGGRACTAITTLLQSPTLKKIDFIDCRFSKKMSLAVAKALNDGSSLTSVCLSYCSFSGGCFLYALQANTTVETLALSHMADVSVLVELNAVCAVNTTLTSLGLDFRYVDCEAAPNVPNLWDWLDPFFRILATTNRTIKSLKLDGILAAEGRLGNALRETLAENSALTELEVSFPFQELEENNLDSWHHDMSFLRGETSLQSLTLHFHQNETEGSQLVGLAKSIFAIINGTNDSSLLTLELDVNDRGGRLLEDLSSTHYVSVMQEFPLNSALESFKLLTSDNLEDITPDETQKLVSAVKSNYRLKYLDSSCEKIEQVGMYLRLNRAGRSYLLDDNPRLGDGFAVLVEVHDNLDCLLTHLLENPSLCKALRSPDNPDAGDIDERNG